MKKLTFDKAADMMEEYIRGRWVHKNGEYDKSVYRLCLNDGFNELYPSLLSGDELDLNEFITNMCSLCTLAIVLRKLYDQDNNLAPDNFACVTEEMKKRHSKYPCGFDDALFKATDDDGMYAFAVSVKDKLDTLNWSKEAEEEKDSLIIIANYFLLMMVWAQNKIMEQEENEDNNF